MPKKLGKYEIGKTLGKGAFSKVKLGTDEDGTQYAIKVLNKEALAKAHQEELLKREVAVMKHLQHPNIVSMREVFQTSNHIYLILELVAGGELLDRIVQKKRFDEDQARIYFQQMIVPIHYCHTQGIAHRDLKPENILLTEHDVLKISDFGLANIQRTNSDGTVAGTDMLQSLCGTPDYVAPEVIKEQGYSGFTADVWSLGVILFVMLAGYPPFNDPSIPVMFDRIKAGNFRMDPKFSESARDLIGKMMTVDPAKRITLDGIIQHPWFRAKGWDDSRLTASLPSSVPVTDSDLASAVQNAELQDAGSKAPPASAPKQATQSDIDAATAGIEKCTVGHEHATQFQAKGSTAEVLKKVTSSLEQMGANPKAKEDKLKITGYAQSHKGLLAYAIEIEKIDDHMSLVRVKRTRGDTFEFHTYYHRIVEVLCDTVIGHEH